LRAIQFVLFGGDADGQVKFDASVAKVRLDFERFDTRYRVIRGRERDKKSWLTLEREDEDKWTSLTRESIAATQRYIEDELLGMDALGFSSSIYVPQGQAGAFVALTAAGRKDLLSRLFGLERYAGWREEAANRLQSERAASHFLGERATDLLTDAKMMMDDNDDARYQQIADRLAAANQREHELEGELEAALDREKARAQVALRAEVESRLAEVEQRIVQAQQQAERRAALAAEAERADYLRDRVVELSRMRDKYTTWAGAARSLQGWRDKLGRTEKQADEAREKLNHLRATHTCPTCAQPAHGIFAAGAEQELQTALDAATAEIADLEQRVGEVCDTKPPEFDEAQFRRVSAQLLEAERAESALAGMADTGGERWEGLRTELQERLASIPVVEVTGPTVDEVRGQLSGVEREQRLAENDALAFKRAREAALEKQHEGKAALAEARSHDAVANDLEYVARAFHRQGIPTMILDNAVDAITDEANAILGKLGAAYTVRMTTDKTTKGGKVRDSLEVLVDEGGLERAVESFSGGEQYRVNIALRLALAATLAAQSGGRPDFLLVDEPTDLDADGMVALAQTLTTLGQQVLLVTHHDDLADEFPQTIFVSRDSAASPSKLRVV
jgi:exonuclease SbcC